MVMGNTNDDFVGMLVVRMRLSMKTMIIRRIIKMMGCL